MKHFNKAVWSGKKVFLNKVKTLLEKHIIFLTFSCQSWTSTKIVRLEKTETFCLSQTWRYNTNHYDQNTRKKRKPLFWVELTFEWYENSMVFRVFSFSLEPMVRRILVWKQLLSLSCSQPCSKFFLDIYKARWHKHFERHFTVYDFMDTDRHMC